MKVNVHFDSDGNLWVGDQSLDWTRLQALLDFLREQGWLLLLRRGGRALGERAPPSAAESLQREVVITVGRARRVTAEGAASADPPQRR